jgi:probable rRNA maturation factor
VVRVRSEHTRGGAAARRLRLRARRFLAALGRSEADLSILLVGDAAIRRINRRWRGVDRATDVLSFPAAPVPVRALGGAALPPGGILGDVVISLDTASRRARRGGRPLSDELDRYLAHGLLHLLGLDHDRPHRAREMAAREEALLRGEGMVGEALGSGASRARTADHGMRARARARTRGSAS